MVLDTSMSLLPCRLPEGRAVLQNKMYNLAWLTAKWVIAGVVVTAIYNFSSWIVKLTTGKAK